MTPEVESFFARWLWRNEQIWQQQIRDKGIGDSQELIKSFRHNLKKLANGYLEGEHEFKTRGRFVDMGVGRGTDRTSRLGRYEEDWSKGRAGRKPKRWYTRALYGRLNDLLGATGARLGEEAIRMTKEQFPTTI